MRLAPPSEALACSPLHWAFGGSLSGMSHSHLWWRWSPGSPCRFRPGGYGDASAWLAVLRRCMTLRLATAAANSGDGRRSSALRTEENRRLASCFNGNRCTRLTVLQDKGAARWDLQSSRPVIGEGSPRLVGVGDGREQSIREAHDPRSAHGNEAKTG